MTDDIISRAAALTALERDEEYDKDIPNRADGVRDAIITISALPSAQPEIIHCKDCKYNPNPPECGNAACVLFYGMTDQMGFCHHGERREQDETD